MRKLNLVVTFSDFGTAANVGGNVEYTSEIISIPEENVPLKLKEYLSNKETRKWNTVLFSLLDEAE